uniref:NIPSNAP domain-containing protein n=1 Tax=Strigamia maritima TaxID=126957 RepID=T1J6G8_STRMM
MAAVLRFVNYQPSKVLSNGASTIRLLATTQTASEDKEGWFTKLLVPKKEPFKESHSRMLSDKETIYQLQTHNVKPDSMAEYIKNYENFVKLANQRNDLDADLMGSWLVDVGDQDQAIHLWRYNNGYAGLGKANSLLRTESDYTKLHNERSKFLRSRLNQYLLSFSFWNAPKPRTGPNLYEMRSYTLRAGHLIEWGNSWARAIHYRQNESEPFCGMFSQCGRLYNVHHVWVYKDLKTRKEVREAAWQKPGWDECVAYTVPLIREMESRIMYPTDFSPTK